MPARDSAVERWKAEAEQRGFEFLRPGEKPERRLAYYRCKECGAERRALVGRVRSGNIQCQSCRAIREQAEASAAGLTLLNRFVRNSGKNSKTTCGRYRCNSCQHEFDAVVSAVRRQDVKCRHCEKLRWEAEASRMRLRFLGRVDDDRGSTRGVYECVDCDGTFDADLGAVRRGDVSCPCCKPSQSAGARLIRDLLSEKGMEFKAEASARIDDSSRRFDFQLEDRIIEYDGEQHFNPNGQFSGDPNDFHKVSHGDHIKNLYCIFNRIPLIRIHYSVRNAGLLPQALDLALTLEVDPEDPVILLAGPDDTVEAVPIIDFLHSDGAASLQAAMPSSQSATLH